MFFIRVLVAWRKATLGGGNCGGGGCGCGGCGGCGGSHQ